MTSKRERVFGGKITAPVTLFGDVETIHTPNTVAIARIRLPDQQPRRYFDPQKMEQLVLSVKEHGILEPLLVRTLDESDVYELVAGERRYRAAKEAGLTDVPAVIRDLTDEQAVQLALIENLQREDLNPIEETEGVLQLLALKLKISVDETPKLLYRMQHEAKGKVAHNVMGSSEDEAIQAVFASLGTMTWESFVNNRLPLLNLPEDVLEALQQGKIAYTKAQAIARVKNEEQRKDLLKKAIAQGLSLAQIKECVDRFKSSAAAAADQPLLKTQIDDVLKLAKRSKIWDDPKKQKKLEKVLADLRSLISDTV
ncbi:ParB/RepB/Spo0J family partition protein (plasmid) [Phormidium sp. CLA17]|uniref:ParB/RepB/Spo0J family partition protein n=1 Tax=Leptolyngbya sp. Cla-17 TaxID=2803751 RepID=UPI001492E94A|nr:ParB/RepB/Spo0J family partition protein [Leptolyngbya sp. Cla-17]MBM0745648.1 ParB/RepB/Spo0J family partition protein [Leptolyngbya sp. Cla-17]